MQDFTINNLLFLSWSILWIILLVFKETTNGYLRSEPTPLQRTRTIRRRPIELSRIRTCTWVIFIIHRHIQPYEHQQSPPKYSCILKRRFNEISYCCIGLQRSHELPRDLRVPLPITSITPNLLRSLRSRVHSHRHRSLKHIRTWHNNRKSIKRSEILQWRRQSNRRIPCNLPSRLLTPWKRWTSPRRHLARLNSNSQLQSLLINRTPHI